MLATLYTDTLTLSAGVVIHKQAIGFVSKGKVPENADGILGLGPTILTEDTLVDAPNMLIPTVIDNLLIQGDIDQRVISYYFPPSLETEVIYGTITFGGIDPPDHTGPITYM